MVRAFFTNKPPSLASFIGTYMISLAFPCLYAFLSCFFDWFFAMADGTTLQTFVTVCVLCAGHAYIVLPRANIWLAHEVVSVALLTSSQFGLAGEGLIRAVLFLGVTMIRQLSPISIWFLIIRGNTIIAKVPAQWLPQQAAATVALWIVLARCVINLFFSAVVVAAPDWLTRRSVVVLSRSVPAVLRVGAPCYEELLAYGVEIVLALAFISCRAAPALLLSAFGSGGERGEAAFFAAVHRGGAPPVATPLPP